MFIFRPWGFLATLAAKHLTVFVCRFRYIPNRSDQIIQLSLLGFCTELKTDQHEKQKATNNPAAPVYHPDILWQHANILWELHMN